MSQSPKSPSPCGRKAETESGFPLTCGVLVGIRIGIVALYLKGLYGSRNPIHIGRDSSPFKSRAYLELKTLYIGIAGLGLRWKMEATRILDHSGKEKGDSILLRNILQ